MITALAMAFIAVRFVTGARDTLARTRDGACIALAPDPLPDVLRNGPPPDFQLPDASGRHVSLNQQTRPPRVSQFLGDLVPALRRRGAVARRSRAPHHGTDMRMLAVSVDDDWDKIRRFFAKGSEIGVLLDTSHDVPKKFGTEKFPETFLIDAAGRIRYYFINKRDWSRPEAVACLESLR